MIPVEVFFTKVDKNGQPTPRRFVKRPFARIAHTAATLTALMTGLVRGEVDEHEPIGRYVRRKIAEAL